MLPPTVLDTVVGAAVGPGVAPVPPPPPLVAAAGLPRSPLDLDRDPLRRPAPRRASDRPLRAEWGPRSERVCLDDVAAAAGPPPPDITLSFQDDALDIVKVGGVVVEEDTGEGSEANAHVIPLEVPVWR